MFFFPPLFVSLPFIKTIAAEISSRGTRSVFKSAEGRRCGTARWARGSRTGSHGEKTAVIDG